jgi:hypothetical protein
VEKNETARGVTPTDAVPSSSVPRGETTRGSSFVDPGRPAFSTISVLSRL